MLVLDPGHLYELKELNGDTQLLKFVKRSGGAIEYEVEHPGLQTQEVLRALIDRTEYLNSIIPCVESEEAAYHLRMALFLYEARAYRRKMEKVNREAPEHDDSASPKAWRENPFDDVPFNETEIELRPIGPDGHILIDTE